MPPSEGVSCPSGSDIERRPTSAVCEEGTTRWVAYLKVRRLAAQGADGDPKTYRTADDAVAPACRRNSLGDTPFHARNAL